MADCAESPQRCEGPGEGGEEQDHEERHADAQGQDRAADPALVAAARSAMASSSRQTPASPEPGKRTSTRWQSRSIVVAIAAASRLRWRTLALAGPPQPGRAAHAAGVAVDRRPSRVSTRSENAQACQSRGTVSYRRAICDMPPPSTMTSGSSMSSTTASARAIRSS